jgi:hypothetical protein
MLKEKRIFKPELLDIMSKNLLSLILMTFLVTACNNVDIQNGPESNPQRKVKGIPIIEKGWISITEDIDDSAYIITWGDDEKHLQNLQLADFNSLYEPRHVQKAIYVKNGENQSEADTYTNASLGDIMYSLTLKYNQDGWEATLGENHNALVIKKRDKDMMDLAILAEKRKINENTGRKRAKEISQTFDREYKFEDKPLRKLSMYQADSVLNKWGISRH